jgi:hypothetical protein
MARWDAACDDLWRQGYYSAEVQAQMKKRAAMQTRQSKRSTKPSARGKR